MVGDVANGKAKVFVVTGDQATLREVLIGNDTGVSLEILSGLSPSDEVVLRPSGGLSDGTKVASTAAPAVAAKTH
jgi:HlyD family secretion protein